MLERNTLKVLKRWQKSSYRKPLLIRGARQVGKTTLVRMLAGKYKNYVELNLEKTSDRELFATDDVKQVLQAIYLHKNISPKKGETLLFIDEIQESPEVIKLLRYFYEDSPEIHVIAAGSLLEFALDKVPNFPVGRMDYLYLHPLNFEEYIRAINTQAYEVYHQLPIPDYAHDTLLKLFHNYAMVGGMPEIVFTYLENRDVVGLGKLYKKLWTSYQDDIEKYAINNTQKTIIHHVVETAPKEKDRIKFENFGSSNYRAREVGDALRMLDRSKLIRLIYPTTNLKPPIIIDLKKRPRLQFLDTGMLNHILLLQSELININDLNDFYGGKIIHHLVYQELISVHNDIEYIPHFWVRENRSSQAEVDLVYPYGKFIIPIEIKSGKQGTLKSLHQFMDRVEHPYAVRLYAGKFSIENHHTNIKKKPYLLMNLPYYLGTKIPSYIRYFINTYPKKTT